MIILDGFKMFFEPDTNITCVTIKVVKNNFTLVPIEVSITLDDTRILPFLLDLIYRGVYVPLHINLKYVGSVVVTEIIKYNSRG